MTKLSAAMIILLSVLFGGSVLGEERKGTKFLLLQSPCNNYAEMERLAEEHGEKLLFMGEGVTFSATAGRPFRGGMAFFVDQEKGNWTMFQLYADGVACMLFNGTNFQPYSGD
tara:strand:- start:2746 stop:3084 length:339 start_codon:yes stop_codon:yes gene_type:complete